MKNTLHTPGPWKKEGATICQANSNQTICKAIGKNESIQSANAHLISAAPDLLSALERLLKISQEELDQSATHDGLVNCEALANARAAIAKAKGEA